MSKSFRLGVDVGGTFTDFVLLDEQQQRRTIGKRLTTPHDLSEAIVSGTRQLVDDASTSAKAITRFVHGTTVITNAIIQRSGARTGLITSQGFRDTLEIGRELRYELYDLFIERAEPLVPRYLRCEVEERVKYDGSVLTPLNEVEVMKSADYLIAEGIEALAIIFLHSYCNPAHEKRARDLIASRYPGLTISISSDIAPEIREYDRTSTTVANAYVRPLMTGYIDRLQEQLRELGVSAPLHLMLSSGGVTTVDVGREMPIQMVESGPAAGAIAASFYGKAINELNILSFDMGGTTAKICLITDGRAAHANEFEAARVQRFKRGSGLIFKVPVVEMIEIGAGGGSIARVDSMGLLKVGPRSAGADPGPACYGRGGTEPTVTDADVVLGYLDPNYFLGGEMKLDVEAARRAINDHVARPLGLDPVRAAVGIYDVINETMNSAMRIYCAEKGADPRRYTMFAFGGAGPVHAYRLARLLKLKRIVFPLGAGAMSALGFLVAPMSVDYVRSYVSRIDRLDWDHVRKIYADMEKRALAMLQDAGVSAADVTIERTVEMRYIGQGYEIPVAMSGDVLKSSSVNGLKEAFRERYEALYERSLPEIPLQALIWRLVGRGPVPHTDLRAATPTSVVKESALKGQRRVYMPEIGDFADVPIFDRYRMRPGDSIDGPAVVEERESTVILDVNCRGSIDGHMNLLVTFD